MLLLVKNEKSTRIIQRPYGFKKKKDYFGIGDFPQYQKEFFPMAELNTIKISMYLWAIWKLWISLSCLIWVAPQSMQGMFLKPVTSTGNSIKNMKI